MKRVIMIHGWAGYPEEEWRPWLKQKLLEKGYKVDIPSMPNSDNPKMTEWLEYLRRIIGKPTEDIILVGHSLGAITILRYLEELKEGEKIGAAIFLAGFSYDLEYEGYNKELANFFETPVNFEEVKKHCNKFIVLHSEDDKWVDIKHAHLFKEKLNAETIIQKSMRHYSGDDGISELPILFELIEKI